MLIEKSGETARKALDMDSRIKKFFTDTHRWLYAQGRAEGKAEGKAEALAMILKQRCIATPDELLLLVLTHTDPGTLDRWLARALSARSVSEIFA